MTKSKWQQIEDKLILIEGWARDGLTEEQISSNLGISRTTLYKYKKEHAELNEHLKKGKEIVDYEVENALLKKALGYTAIVYKEKVTKDGDIVQVREDVHIPPDTIALIYWLKNRKPSKWKDKREVETNVEELSKVEQLLSKIKEEAKK